MSRSQSFRRLFPRLARLAVALGVVSLVWACSAPYFPVPPPNAAFTSALVSDGAGGQKTLWTTTGSTNGSAAFARFFIFDVERNVGVIAGADQDGAYVAPAFEGKANDHIQLYFETPEGDHSPTSCLLLVEGAQAPHCQP